MKTDLTSSLYGRWTITLAVIAALTGFGLSWHLRSRIAQTEADAAQLTAQALQTHTERELARFVEVLESVRALLTLSHAIDQAAMTEFIEKGLVHQQAVLGAFGLAQRIDHPLRLAIESKEKPGPGAYDIVQPGPDGTWIPAEARSLYYPLTWQSQSNGLNVPIGFDMLSTRAARRAVGQMEHLHQTVLVPEKLSEPSGGGYWILSPVIPRSAPRSIIGCAVAILRPEMILQKVASTSATHPKLKLTLSAAPMDKSILLADKAWLIRTPIQAIGTQWLFECSLPLSITGHRSETAFITGLVFTSLITALLLLLGSRTRKIEAEVKTRTEDLRIANTQLEENLHERARMEEEMNELAARERRRIGRDLHDSLGQKLTGAVFLSRSLLNWLRGQGSEIKGQESGDRNQESEVEGSAFAKAAADRQESGDRNQESEVGGQQTENPPSELETRNSTAEGRGAGNTGQRSGKLETRNSELETQTSHAQTLNETLKSSVSQVRNMARGLASVTLNEENLEESLDQLADEMGSLYNTSCRAEHAGSLPELSRKTKEQLYFIAREAVNNAARHAQAQHISIRLSGDPSAWTLRIEDDGIGLPEKQTTTEGAPCSVPEAPLQGMGLRIMRHRATRIGAEFAIHSAPDHGTTIEVTRKNESDQNN